MSGAPAPAAPAAATACPCCGQLVAPLGILFDGRIVAHGGRQLRLSPQLASLFKLLLDAWPRSVTYDAIRLALDIEDRHPEFQKVLACHLRQRLAPLGLAIETIWAEGLRLATSDAARATLADRRRADRLAAPPDAPHRIAELLARGYGDQQIAAVLHVPYGLVAAVRAVTPGAPASGDVDAA